MLTKQFPPSLKRQQLILLIYILPGEKSTFSELVLICNRKIFFYWQSFQTNLACWLVLTSIIEYSNTHRCPSLYPPCDSVWSHDTVIILVWEKAQVCSAINMRHTLAAKEMIIPRYNPYSASFSMNHWDTLLLWLIRPCTQLGNAGKLLDGSAFQEWYFVMCTCAWVPWREYFNQEEWVLVLFHSMK